MIFHPFSIFILNWPGCFSAVQIALVQVFKESFYFFHFCSSFRFFLSLRTIVV